MNRFERIAQRMSILRRAQALENIQSLPGVKSSLFGAQTWGSINNFMNALNDGIIELGAGRDMSGKPLNFQTIVNNKSQVGTLTGSLKNLADLSIKLWNIVTGNRTQTYTIDEARAMADDFQNTLNSMSFVETNAAAIKTKISNSINNWKAALPGT